MNSNGKSRGEISYTYNVMSREMLSPYEHRLESIFRRKLSDQDFRDLNAQSRRCNDECGECVCRMATEEEMKRTSLVRPYQEIKFKKDVGKSDFSKNI